MKKKRFKVNLKFLLYFNLACFNKQGVLIRSINLIMNLKIKKIFFFSHIVFYLVLLMYYIHLISLHFKSKKKKVNK